MSSMIISLALFSAATLAIPVFPQHAAAPFNGTENHIVSIPSATGVWDRRQLYPTAFPSDAAPFDKRQLYPTGTAAPWDRRQLYPTGAAPPWNRRQLSPTGIATPVSNAVSEAEQEVAEDAVVLSRRFQGPRQHSPHYYPIASPEGPIPAPTGVLVRAVGPTARFAQPSGARYAAGPTARFAQPTGAKFAVPTGY